MGASLEFTVQYFSIHGAFVNQMLLAIRRHIGICRYIQSSHQSCEVAQRKSHHAGETTTEILNGMKFRVLDGVGTGFIERITAGDVRANLLVGVSAHRHIGDAQVGEEKSVARSQQGKPGVDLMRPPAQASQHGEGFRVIAGFAEDVASVHHGRISRKDDSIRIHPACNRAGFGFRKP